MVKLYRETCHTVDEVNTLTESLRRQSKEYTIVHANDLTTVIWAEMPLVDDEETFHFTLVDEADDAEVTGTVSTDNNLGLAIQLDGFGTADNPSGGSIVFLERYEGKTSVLVYADNSKDEPTHVINLEGAQIEENNMVKK
ncbi:hypothetical protein [Alteromonas stellipolaris]|jgi:hypothetical protein|uniref:Uncharacterized protein n=1 Tax=Alteromonas stellipolaris TaxID=233316 RepID=A0ABN4LTU1_9ALTE|nr:hypothetical protein [Alteromonas stellipolaris]AMJ76604.1 hypothetical protein AVL57_00205 [Alteromonas stellipolaris]MBZ2163205.1 hypothetical protein [Alteromonas stellipolaris]